MKNKPIDNQKIEADVGLSEFCERLNLAVLNDGGKQTIHIATVNVTRPGLQLTGFFEHFASERVQVMGEAEYAYLSKLSPAQRKTACDTLFAYDFPCLVLAKIDPLPEVLEAAKTFGRILLRSDLHTTGFINEISIYLNELLAPSVVIHGGLVDIFGVGVLIVGRSSVGKSEAALELVQRGHRLVADDAVCIKRISDRLVGEAPETIRHFMEIRGIGLIDIYSMYGAGAVRKSKVVDIVVQLENWNEKKEYDRLGDKKLTYNLLQMDLPMYEIPVKPGRNLAAILEVVARQFRSNTMGYHALDELNRRLKNRSV